MGARKSKKAAAEWFPKTFPTIHVELAGRYAQNVVSGAQPACQWVKKAAQRQIDDRAREADPAWPWRFDKQAAERVCHFLERCRHIKGPKRGEPLCLEPWQCFVLTVAFGWVSKQTGKRRFRRVYCEVPRGNAKSTLSAGLSLFGLAMDGEGGAEVYSAATTADQARIVFGIAQAMARAMPEFREQEGVTVEAHSISQIRSASVFRPLSSDSHGLEGLNVHLAVIDELHAHATREVYDVLDTATGKRDQSMLWIITTAGTDRQGICYEVRNYLTKILDGVAEDERTFGVIYTIDEDDWTDPAAWQKANPNWSVSVFPDDLALKCAKAQQLASAQPAFQTRHLNLWVSSYQTWMNMPRWHACADANLDDMQFEGEPAIVTCDLASKLDLAAVLHVFTKAVDGKPHYFAFGDYWLPEAVIEREAQFQAWASAGYVQTSPGETNDFDVIEARVRELASQFKVSEFVHDEWQAHQLATHLQTEGMLVVKMPMRTQYLSPGMKELEAAVLEGRLHHNGDPLLAWCISNVVSRTDRNENIFPTKERPENKIDAAVALIMGLSRLIAETPVSEGSIYNDTTLRPNGILSI